MIVVRTSSDAITTAGGIWFGMSGSPVYDADGHLVGAVAYGLAGASPIAGITPAAEMRKLLRGGGAAVGGAQGRVDGGDREQDRGQRGGDRSRGGVRSATAASAGRRVGHESGTTSSGHTPDQAHARRRTGVPVGQRLRPSGGASSSCRVATSPRRRLLRRRDTGRGRHRHRGVRRRGAALRAPPPLERRHHALGPPGHRGVRPTGPDLRLVQGGQRRWARRAPSTRTGWPASTLTSAAAPATSSRSFRGDCRRNRRLADRDDAGGAAGVHPGCARCIHVLNNLDRVHDRIGTRGGHAPVGGEREAPRWQHLELPAAREAGRLGSTRRSTRRSRSRAISDALSTTASRRSRSTTSRSRASSTRSMPRPQLVRVEKLGANGRWQAVSRRTPLRLVAGSEVFLRGVLRSVRSTRLTRVPAVVRRAALGGQQREARRLRRAPFFFEEETGRRGQQLRSAPRDDRSAHRPATPSRPSSSSRAGFRRSVGRRSRGGPGRPRRPRSSAAFSSTSGSFARRVAD